MDSNTCSVCFDECTDRVQFSNQKKCNCNFTIHSECYQRLVRETKISCIFCRTPIININNRRIPPDNQNNFYNINEINQNQIIYDFSYIVPITVFILNFVINYFFPNIALILKHVIIGIYISCCIMKFPNANMFGKIKRFVIAINFRYAGNMLDEIR